MGRTPFRLLSLRSRIYTLHTHACFSFPCLPYTYKPTPCRQAGLWAEAAAVASAHLLPTDPFHQHLRCALAAHLEARGNHTAAAANHLLGGQPAAAARALLAAGGFPAAAAAAEVCARALVSKVGVLGCGRWCPLM